MSFKFNPFTQKPDYYEAAAAVAAHAGTHVTGGDDTVANAIAAGNAGLMTGADKTKIDGIEALADVTDAINIGTSTHGVANKATPVDADKVPLIDTEAANVLKTSTWTQIKAFLKTYFDTLYFALSGGTLTGTLTVVTGTTTVAPIKMVAGTNLTTPVAGAIEFDGTDFYITV